MVFQESQSSAFWFQPVWGPGLVVSLKLSSPILMGALIRVEELRDAYQIVM